MAGFLKQLREEVEAWPGITEGPSTVGNPGHPAWFAGGHEFAHWHSDTVLDLRLPSALQRNLRSDDRAIFRKHPSPWMEFRLHSSDDTTEALRLLRAAARAAGERPDKKS